METLGSEMSTEGFDNLRLILGTLEVHLHVQGCVHVQKKPERAQAFTSGRP